MMSAVALVHPQLEVLVSALQLISKCTLFRENQALAGGPYIVRSLVPLAIFQQFVSALEDGAIAVTAENAVGLLSLAVEFGFRNSRRVRGAQRRAQTQPHGSGSPLWKRGPSSAIAKSRRSFRASDGPPQHR
jgi:hypothetical protein